MKILYVSCLCSLPTFSALFPDPDKMPGQQIQKYHRMLVEGLACHTNVHTVSNYPISRSNCKALYLRAGSDTIRNVQYGYLAACNIPVLKNIWNFMQSFSRIWKAGNAGSQTAVICDILNISISMGALLAAKLRGIPTVGIVTDVPAYRPKTTNSFVVKINTTLMNAFDSYVLLTKAMTEVVDCSGKPYKVIEGQVDIHMDTVPNLLSKKYEKKVCLYAGGLHRIYGIPYLVQAFIKADVPNTELHIYGSGDYREELTALCRQHPSIRYFGVKPNAEVVEAELKATLLINPRPTTDAYTKYSFPSKNMEYMVSGTPLLTTKLPGMPAEYYKYVYLIDEETVTGLSNKLTRILSKPPEELHAFGAKAREFVLREKNNVRQAQQIIDLIKECFRGKKKNSVCLLQYDCRRKHD